MRPAREDFEAIDPARAQVDQRLVVRPDGAARDSGTDIDLEFGFRAQLLAHALLEKLKAGARLRLCPIHRRIGRSYERIGVLAIAPIEGDPDAPAHLDLAITGFEWNPDR